MNIEIEAGCGSLPFVVRINGNVVAIFRLEALAIEYKDFKEFQFNG